MTDREPSAGGSPWLPIAIAPRDGTRIIVLSIDDAEWEVAWNPLGTSWIDAGGEPCQAGIGAIRTTGHWRADEGWFQPNEVTHWRPLGLAEGAQRPVRPLGNA